ncbi:NUDIX domain-containing protein [Sphingomonas sp. MMS12-HWE2-04]|uniref:NUDIX domain-containing protein n=1 Tax=Sphingomonas sp. MMS12-HWE2-04 TaxID=3234199 RepID=UPI0038508AA8
MLLVHPGGPFWARKDVGAWQIAKGEVEPGEREEDAARREAREELGIDIDAALQPLGELLQKGGKRVTAFACPLTFDPDKLRSITFEMEWPPRSGQKAQFPEVDAARWMETAQAEVMMLESQRPLLVRLEALLKGT